MSERKALLLQWEQLYGKNRGNYWERGQRLYVWFKDLYGYKSKRAFAKRTGIHESHVNKYFSGQFDPLGLAEPLAKDGCDTHWLGTGKWLNQAEIIITEQDKAILTKLKSLGIDTPEKVDYILSPAALASDIATVVAERIATYGRKQKRKRK